MRAARTLALWNPPVLDEQLQLRASALGEGAKPRVALARRPRDVRDPELLLVERIAPRRLVQQIGSRQLKHVLRNGGDLRGSRWDNRMRRRLPRHILGHWFFYERANRNFFENRALFLFDRRYSRFARSQLCRHDRFSFGLDDWRGLPGKLLIAFAPRPCGEPVLPALAQVLDCARRPRYNDRCLQRDGARGAGCRR